MVADNIIKSENAAKPHTLQSKAVLDYLRSQKPMDNTLDFGCGKLRYSDEIVGICKEATFLDSEIQLARVQTINGIKTSVSNYVIENYPHCAVVAFENIEQHNCKYDFIVCTNVLSAIPCQVTIDLVLYHINRMLKDNGKAVFVNQHRSSYFKKYEVGKKHLYGFLYPNRKGTSYYGIMDLEKVENLVKRHDLNCINAWNSGETNFVEVKRKNKKRSAK